MVTGQFREKGRTRCNKEQRQYTSPEEKSSSTDNKTSSEREDVKHEVMRPTPFAADQRTTVSCINKKIGIKQEKNGEKYNEVYLNKVNRKKWPVPQQSINFLFMFWKKFRP